MRLTNIFHVCSYVQVLDRFKSIFLLVYFVSTFLKLSRQRNLKKVLSVKSKKGLQFLHCHRYKT